MRKILMLMVWSKWLEGRLVGQENVWDAKNEV